MWTKPRASAPASPQNNSPCPGVRRRKAAVESFGDPGESPKRRQLAWRRARIWPAAAPAPRLRRWGSVEFEFAFERGADAVEDFAFRSGKCRSSQPPKTTATLPGKRTIEYIAKLAPCSFAAARDAGQLESFKTGMIDAALAPAGIPRFRKEADRFSAGRGEAARAASSPQLRIEGSDGDVNPVAWSRASSARRSRSRVTSVFLVMTMHRLAEARASPRAAARQLSARRSAGW